MRISNTPQILILLAACSDVGTEAVLESDPLVAAEAQVRAELAESGLVYCALHGAANFNPEGRSSAPVGAMESSSRLAILTEDFGGCR